MMIYCWDCDDFFDEEDATSRLAELEDGVPRGTRIMTCPWCGGSDLEEAKTCMICGKPLRPKEYDFCAECTEDLDKSVEAIIDEIMGDSLDARQAFFDYLERRWY